MTTSKRFDVPQEDDIVDLGGDLVEDGETTDVLTPEDIGAILEEEPDASDLSGKVERASAAERGTWQKMEQVKGRIDDFDADLLVHFDMRKDQDKRPDDEPGEDMVLADRKTGLTGVFDGLGGEGSGAAASAKAAEMAPLRYEQAKEAIRKNPGRIEELAAKMFEREASLLHPSLRKQAQEGLLRMWNTQMPEAVRLEMLALHYSMDKLNEDVTATGGKTTITLGKTVKVGDRTYEVIVNIGDGGAFKVREDGTASELTVEDSAIDVALSAGLLTPEQAQDPDHVVSIGGKDVKVSKLRTAMSQALGANISSPRIIVNEIRRGESVVYVTDGIRDIRDFESRGRFDPEKAAKALATEDGENLASALAGHATKIERAQKSAWGMEKARAEMDNRLPDPRSQPKLDEKAVLVKTRRANDRGLRIAS